MLKFRIYNIQYDTDGEDLDVALPQDLEAEVEDTEDLEDQLSDFVTEQTGWCHRGFLYEEVD